MLTTKEINDLQGTEEYDAIVNTLRLTGHQLHYVACAAIAQLLKEKVDRLQEAEKQVATLLLLNGAKESEQAQPMQEVVDLENPVDVRMDVAIVLLSGYERLALAVLSKI